jgi:hypothetical protein
MLAMLQLATSLAAAGLGLLAAATAAYNVDNLRAFFRARRPEEAFETDLLADLHAQAAPPAAPASEAQQTQQQTPPQRQQQTPPHTPLHTPPQTPPRTPPNIDLPEIDLPDIDSDSDASVDELARPRPRPAGPQAVP